MRRSVSRGGPSAHPRRGKDEPGAGVEIRFASAGDVAAIAAIESEAFTSPWTGSAFRALLGRPGACVWVATGPDDAVVGYAVFWHILDEGELANIAVRKDRRGEGIGSRLLDRVFAEARERNVRRLHLEVRASNRRAIRLYRQRGFRTVGRREGYYDSPRESALILSRKLDD